MRARFALLLLAMLLVPGCASPGGKEGVSQVSGVAGAIDLKPGPGLVVTPSPENRTIVVGLASVAQSQVLQACAGECRNLTVLPGSLIAEGPLLAMRNLSLNAVGPEGDSAVYFYDHGQETGRFLRWADAQERFTLNGDLQVVGNVTATSWTGTRTPLVVNAPSGQQILVTVTTAATEGMEPTIFARGAGKLTEGSATIALPSSFVALEGEGALSAQVTLTSRGPALFVEKARDHLTIATADGSTPSDVTFDWFVQAPRKGAEGFEV